MMAKLCILGTAIFFIWFTPGIKSKYWDPPSHLVTIMTFICYQLFLRETVPKNFRDNDELSLNYTLCLIIL